MTKEYALEKATLQDGESMLNLSLSDDMFITVDGDIRIYLKSVDGRYVRLAFIAPREVAIRRSNMVKSEPNRP